MFPQGASPSFEQKTSNSSISSWLKSLRESVVEFSATGKAVVDARTSVRNALAEGRNADAVNSAIAEYASGNARAEAIRAQREALEAAGQTGLDGNPFTGPRGTMNLLLLVAAVAGAYMISKR